MDTLIIIIAGLAFIQSNVKSTMSHEDDLDGKPLVYRGKVASPSEVPWHAGIWRPDGPRYDQLCGGTLIAPNLVVTAAHCFWDFGADKEIPNLNTYQVALGKVYRNWSLDGTNPYVQRMDIQRVILESRFDGFQRKQLEHDIALVELTKNATLTDFVQVAAIDWYSRTPANGSVGVVAGWGYTEEDDFALELRSIELPYIDHETCYKSLGADRFKKLLKRDKFCAGFLNKGKSICQGDSGGGFVTIDNKTKIATVRGIVSLDFRPSEYPKVKCYALHYTGFTNIGDELYLKWIRNAIDSVSGPPKRCPAIVSRSGLAKGVQLVICSRNQKVANCSLSVASRTLAITQCSSGYIVPGNQTSKSSLCGRDGIWSDPDFSCQQADPCLPSPCGLNSQCQTVNRQPVCRCLPTYIGSPPNCRPECEMTSECALDRVCVDKTCVDPCLGRCGVNSSCTIVDHSPICSCPPGYTGDPDVKCYLTPDCGRQHFTTVRIGDEDFQEGSLPWNVNIYKEYSFNTNGWAFKCPATLITSRHAVTVAWCVTENYDVFMPTKLRLAAGKRQIDYSDDHSNSQLRGVSSVIRHELYDATNRLNDIALIVANQSFELSTKVNVACVDWMRALQAGSSNVFIGAAWIGSSFSQYTTTQSFSFMDETLCSSSVPDNVRHHLTEHRFCGRQINNDTCNDYRGSGLLMQRKSSEGAQYFFWGINNALLNYENKGECGNNRLNVYTEVAKYLPWIREHLTPT